MPVLLTRAQGLKAARARLPEGATAALLTMIVSSGCGPGSIPEYDAFECVEDQTLCVTLEVPEDYDGTPRELATILYDSIEAQGPPSAALPAIEYPSVAAGQAYELSHEQVDIEGEFYLMFVLYDEAGGTWIPEPGVDYSAITSSSLQLDGRPLELGVLTLSEAQ